MEKRIVDILNAVNARFYQDHAVSFSQTRKNPWEGWLTVGKAFDALADKSNSPLQIVDVGCGNMRFERFVESSYPHRRFEFTCIDSCIALVPEISEYRFIERDVVSELAEGRLAIGNFGNRFDAAVAFGIMHHIPGRENRQTLLQQLCTCVKPGGLVALSFWQFMDEFKLEAKAQEATERAIEELELTPSDLEENDFFLGWANDPTALRYCHHFDDKEVEDMIDRVSLSIRKRVMYKADKKNLYAVLYIV